MAAIYWMPFDRTNRIYLRMGTSEGLFLPSSVQIRKKRLRREDYLMIYLFALIFLIIKSIKKWHGWKINEEKTGRAHIHMNWIWPQVCLWPLKTNTLWKSEPLWDCCSLQTRHPLWSKVRSFVSRHDIPPMRGHLLSIKRGCAEQIRGLNSKDQATDNGWRTPPNRHLGHKS